MRSEMTLERGEAINSIEDRSVRMSEHAETFKKRAAETKRHFCFAHYRNILILIAILAVRRRSLCVFRCLPRCGVDESGECGLVAQLLFC